MAIPQESEAGSGAGWLRQWRADLACAAGFLTRLPVPQAWRADAPDLAHALRAFPLVGAVVGLAGGLACCIGSLLGLPPLVWALLALATLALVTGALHEDGLADCADALGAGSNRDKALAIMRDSRIGSYGVLALILVTGLKAAGLASLAPADALLALVAACIAARGLLAGLATMVRPARPDGLGAALARVNHGVLLQTLLFAGLLPVAVTLSIWAVPALLAAAVMVAAVGQQAQQRLGGQTGDVFGAAEQLAETAILLVFSAVWS